MATPKILVVGSCFTDLISYSSRLPKPGETLIGTKFQTGFGGKGGNQCVAAAKLGASVAMVSKLGDDAFGKLYSQNFTDLGVNVDCVEIVPNVSTGSANIMVAQGGENCIVVVRGANELITSDDIHRAKRFFEEAAILICQFEIPMEPTIAALKLAKECGMTTILNAAPGLDVDDTSVFQCVDILCVNETEAEILTKMPVKDVEGARRGAQLLLKRGCGKVIVTLGENGVVYAGGKDAKVTHIPVEKVKAVDTTGAGDAFVGAMAYYLAYHPKFHMEKVIGYSCAIATMSVQKEGTQSSFPDRKEIPNHFFQ